ncbi:DcaP family trimeric outer membrane transporter [Bremerella sp. P1]|uniref:DcaP family trimeric outer membrane transporter n=1 Tax=Bremerella sp. P1 TaxID=3026424 RepID=UPI002368D2D3|nr:DcaP family trimeric outer membrane transporter [Bremerella sp. P1]WDI43254.1 DcaP family trimeric outer membrane transporter [Bremerella sp. P1]
MKTMFHHFQTPRPVTSGIHWARCLVVVVVWISASCLQADDWFRDAEEAYPSVTSNFGEQFAYPLAVTSQAGEVMLASHYQPVVTAAANLQPTELTPPQPPNLLPVSTTFLQPAAETVVSMDPVLQNFSGQQFMSDSRRLDIGFDFYSAPSFDDGLILYGNNVAMKIGGYVKADFIYDFDPIDSTDSFVTTDIPVGAPPRTNSRFHARQTRMSFDTRWLATDNHVVRIYVEGDFFSDDNQFRLRHAYGESGHLLVGRTFTTFTDTSAAPATLDFEGSVSAVNRRQAQARWTTFFLREDIELAVAVEDTRFIIDVPMGVMGESRSPSPDFVGHLRWDKEWGQFQVASLHRIGGFQPDGEEVITRYAWGFNFTGAMLVRPRTKAYYQIVFGDGIGSYRDLPDAAPISATQSDLLSMVGWMVGMTHEWNDEWASNFTYAENTLDNLPGQDGDDVHETTYLAVNLIWQPSDRIRIGTEYLYGIRENINGDIGAANRLQTSFIFDLP